MTAGAIDLPARPSAFRDGRRDAVIGNAVLHYTSDARLGFEALLRKVKPGGLILIGRKRP